MTAAPSWTPDETRIATSNLVWFTKVLQFRLARHFPDYEELHKFSTTRAEEFWSELWDFAGIIGDKGRPPWLVDANAMPGARYFPGARLNYAENLLTRRGAHPALIFADETKEGRVSWDELNADVAKFQGWLGESGIGAGDRVAAIAPNIPESVVALLGSASVGSIWASCSPDFGISAVLSRFNQVRPKVLVTCDGYQYAGKSQDTSDKLIAILSKLPSVEHVIIIPCLGRADEMAHRINSDTDRPNLRAVTWGEAIHARPSREPIFLRLPFAHPLCILFSSGTTGLPKCIMHSAGGLLLKHLSEHILHSDLKPNDRLFYFTTLGWMMWNWLVSGLAAGATLLLYDGSPFYPDAYALWDYAARERCTHFGTSAKYMDTLRKEGLEPGQNRDLSDLRTVLSTGSPLAPDNFDYVYASIKRDLHLASISGGTDICGCFALGIPTKPVWRGEIQAPALGAAIDVVDHEGHPLSTGKGELVCRNSLPSMPLGFCNDPHSERYISTYFSQNIGIWTHGDFAEWTQHGGIVVHGRSDATLNPGGGRIGTMEIYREVDRLSEVQESVAIGQEWQGDVRIVLFVVLRRGENLTEELKERIKLQICQGASPRHVPAKILAVDEIPRTKTGKIAELAIRDIVMGRDVKNMEALANPKALEQFRELDELNT